MVCSEDSAAAGQVDHIGASPDIRADRWVETAAVQAGLDLQQNLLIP